MSDDISLAFKLNIYGHEANTPFEVFAAQARHAEDVGFDGVYVVDHLYLPPERYVAYTWSDPSKPYFLDAWSVLAALGATTRRVRLGPQVSPLTFRHPAQLAKMAATVDLISNGRVILQLGTGWHREEHEAYGLPFPEEVTDRVDRMVEGVTVIRGLWQSTDRFSFSGRHFRLRDAPFWPKPVQRPGPPIWFGGSTKRSQQLVAQIGDGWTPAMPQGGGMGVERYRSAVDGIRQQAESLGRDPGSITAGLLLTTAVHEDRGRAADLASVLTRRTDYAGRSLDDLAAQGALVWGTPEDCLREVERYVEAGARHLTLNFVPFGDAAAAMRGMELYASWIRPRLAAS